MYWFLYTAPLSGFLHERLLVAIEDAIGLPEKLYFEPVITLLLTLKSTSPHIVHAQHGTSILSTIRLYYQYQTKITINTRLY